MVNKEFDAFAKVLRTDESRLLSTEERLAHVTGKKGLMEELFAKNESIIEDRLGRLGLPKDAGVRQIYNALIEKVKKDDKSVAEFFGNPDWRDPKECQRIADVVRGAINPPKGFFLKQSKAEEFLRAEPPLKILKFLGYENVDAMLAKEDFWEVYSSLRFIEGSEWLNTVFFKQYENLKPEDFEEREIQIKVLDAKWGEEAKKFVEKKRHNISHLKELGIIFIFPIMLGLPGELLRMVALIMHYLYEVPFYASTAKSFATEPDFADKYVSLLRGDVPTKQIEAKHKSAWLVVQRYLSKDDENDWRLYVPHINPEAIHWDKAEENLGKLFGDSADLGFWHDLGWVGDVRYDESGLEVVLNFNFVDTIFDLVKEGENVKFVYHQQEALWNKIFESYFSKVDLEQFAKSNILKGYFEL